MLLCQLKSVAVKILKDSACFDDGNDNLVISPFDLKLKQYLSKGGSLQLKQACCH